MRTIHILSGVPGSGKSFWAEQNVGDGFWARRDDWRDELRKEVGSTKYFPVPQNEEFTRWKDFLNRVLENEPDRNVIIDQTTIGCGALEKILAALTITANDHVVVTVMHKPLLLCIRRNLEREEFRRVEEKVIRDMHKRMVMQPLDLWNVRCIAKHLNLPGKTSVKVVK